jgi:predicted 2-oxoglutarate/Fe(II)-dependent dioxygenase YbiX
VHVKFQYGSEQFPAAGLKELVDFIRSARYGGPIDACRAGPWPSSRYVVLAKLTEELELRRQRKMSKKPDENFKQFPITHQSGLVPSDAFVQVIPHDFTPSELAQLRALIDEESAQGSIQSVDQLEGGLAQQRRSRTRHLNPMEYSWVCGKLRPIVIALNRKYRFDIFGISELQLAYYDAADEGFYNWHMDIDPGQMSRKITLSMALSDPADYEGGDVEFNTGGNTDELVQTAPRSQTDLVAFPPFVLHRVTPVTRGRRYVLIAWIHGNDWR